MPFSPEGGSPVPDWFRGGLAFDFFDVGVVFGRIGDQNISRKTANIFPLACGPDGDMVRL